MVEVKSYTPEQLRMLRTRKLSWLYLNFFTLQDVSSGAAAQLGPVTRILAKRDFSERKELYRSIKRLHDREVRNEYYERAKVLHDMMEHCERYILD
jgi:hypothetical protein